MTYKDIVTKRTYTKNGEEKTVWLNVGTMRVSDDGKEFIELNMYPNTPFYVFEKKAKETYEEQSDRQFNEIAKSFVPSANDDISGIPF